MAHSWRSRHHSSGFMLLTSLLVITALGTLVTVGITRSAMNMLASEHSAAAHQRVALVEAALDEALSDATNGFRTKVSNFQDSPQQLSTIDLTTDTACDLTTTAKPAQWRTAAIAPAPDGEVTEYCIAPVGAERLETDADGVYSFVQDYRLDARLRQGTHVSQALVQILQYRKTPLFQYLAFYNDDLEILQLPSITLDGKIHTNKNLYISPGSGEIIRLESSVTATGDFFAADSVDLSDRSWRNIAVKRQGSSPPTYPGVPWGEFDETHPGSEMLDSRSPLWKDAATTIWQGGFKTKDHQVLPKALPNLRAAIDPAGFYDQKAMACGVEIVNTNGTNAVYVAGNRELSWESLIVPLVQNQTFYDHRQSQQMAVANVDVTVLESQIQNNPGLFSGCGGFNGAVYLESSAPSASTAFRLSNGTTINTSMAFVTHGLMYIRGHFNATLTSRAAVMADALTVLSTAWNDANSEIADPLSARVAEATAVQAAILTGNQPTPTSCIGSGDWSCYGGGFENSLSLLENWTDKSLTFKGSFVQAWDSQYAGPWRSPGVYYTRPNRVWQFDVRFLDRNTLPPLSPTTVSTVQAYWDYTGRTELQEPPQPPPAPCPDCVEMDPCLQRWGDPGCIQVP